MKTKLIILSIQSPAAAAAATNSPIQRSAIASHHSSTQISSKTPKQYTTSSNNFEQASQSWYTTLFNLNMQRQCIKICHLQKMPLNFMNTHMNKMIFHVIITTFMICKSILHWWMLLLNYLIVLRLRNLQQSWVEDGVVGRRGRRLRGISLGVTLCLIQIGLINELLRMFGTWRKVGSMWDLFKLKGCFFLIIYPFAPLTLLLYH